MPRTIKAKCINTRRDAEGKTCPIATEGRIIDAPERDLRCPECKARLVPVKSGPAIPVPLIAAAIGGVIVLGGGVYMLIGLIPSSKTVACDDEGFTRLGTAEDPNFAPMFVKGCLDAASGGNPSALSLGVRALRVAADKGDGAAALQLGQLYDPTQADAGKLINPDIYVAYQWYRTAMDNGTGEAKARLEALKPMFEAAMKSGDTRARVVLDSWPR